MNSIRIGIAGLGTVGVGVVKLLQGNKTLLADRSGRDIEIVAVSSRNKNKARDVILSGITWCDTAIELATRPDIDIIVETIGGSEGPARELVEAALTNGKHVVTANKALIAHHGADLAALSEKHKGQLAFEASVAGGIPILQALRTGLAANSFKKIAGILNGTCNYILTTMEKDKADFVDVLADAQAKGYAEADPGFDIDGVDASHKLAILAALAYGTRPALDAVHVEGIRHITGRDIAYAAELGFRIRLLGVATQTNDGISQRVHPCLVPAGSPLGQTEGVFNAVQVEGDAVGRVLFQGRGAGAGPTASAVVSDIIAIARGERWPAFTHRTAKLTDATRVPMEQHKASYYIRLTVADEPGVLADVTRIFADEKISVQSLIQHTHDDNAPAQVVITTHRTMEASMQNALKKIHALACTVEAPVMLRMETV